jgi:hypothetical protein
MEVGNAQTDSSKLSNARFALVECGRHCFAGCQRQCWQNGDNANANAAEPVPREQLSKMVTSSEGMLVVTT